MDLSGLIHDRAHHADLVPISVFAWWILATSALPPQCVIRVPDAGSSQLRHLARAGLITAASTRGVKLVLPNGEPFREPHLFSDATVHQNRLPGVDWQVLDELVAGDRLRIIPDLVDVRRRVPQLTTSRLHYAWLANLGLGSAAISTRGFRRFLADADTVVAELIDNVHRWSRCTLAFAVASATRGGELDDGARRSWNRLHIVVADNGVGIPQALRADLEACQAVSDAAGLSATLADDLSDDQLVERLLRHAFGDRQLPNHNGHGLNATQIRAGQWVGAVDVVTSRKDRTVLRKGSRGLDPTLGIGMEADDQLSGLPGVHGTLVHVLLQATDEREVREEAAEQERLPFHVHDYEIVSRQVYGNLAAV